MLPNILHDQTIKIVFLGIIVFIAFALQCSLLYSLFKKRKEIDFLSCIKRDGRISKAGLFFFVLMGIIAYQALFADNIDSKLVDLMALIIGGDLGATWLSNNKYKNERQYRDRYDDRYYDRHQESYEESNYKEMEESRYSNKENRIEK